MSLVFSILVPFYSIALILSLLIALFRFLYREKYAESLLKIPEARREKFLQYEKKMVKLLKMSLLPVLLLSILLPLAVFLLYREYFLATTVGTIVFPIYTLQEYGFRKWLVNWLEAREILK